MKKLLIPVFIIIAASANAQEVVAPQKAVPPANAKLNNAPTARTPQAGPAQSATPAKAPGTSLRPGQATQAQKKTATAPTEKPAEKK